MRAQRSFARRLRIAAGALRQAARHLAFGISSRDEVDRLHAIALDAGWTVVRDPKPYPRFNERYYACFIEDSNGIRIEFANNAPRESTAG